MAKLYVFPTPKHLPQDLEKCLQEIGEAYIKVLYYALTTLSSDNPTSEELGEIRELVTLAYAEGMNKAIKELEP